MCRIDFYHLQKQGLNEVLPKLLLKAYDAGVRIVVRTSREDRVSYLSDFLWTFQDDSFIPHGSKKDGFAEQQIIWLTSEKDNPNHAKFLFLVDDAEVDTDELDNYERILNIFDGNNDYSLQKSRQLWKSCGSGIHELHYWQQTDAGKWLQIQ